MKFEYQITNVEWIGEDTNHGQKFENEIWMLNGLVRILIMVKSFNPKIHSSDNVR